MRWESKTPGKEHSQENGEGETKKNVALAKKLWKAKKEGIKVTLSAVKRLVDIKFGLGSYVPEGQAAVVKT